MKSYFQGMITGGSLMITFFVLTASQIPIAEDSGTFNTLNVETINVSKSININDKILIYHDEESGNNAILFLDENGNEKIYIAHGKEAHGVYIRNVDSKSKNLTIEGLGLGIYNNKPTIEFYNNDKAIIDLGIDRNNNGYINFFNNNEYRTIALGHDVRSNGMLEIKNNNDNQSFILGHTNDDDGVFQIRDRNGNPTHESP